MKKLAKLWSIILTVFIVISLFSGCGGKKQSKGEKIVISAALPGSENSYRGDEIYKLISDKFNVEFEFNATTIDTMTEKTRLWVASGSLSDITFSDFTYKDYLSWGKQGLVKALPEDYKEKYPNLAKGLEQTMILPKLEKDGQGAIFGIPRAMSSVYQYGFTDVPNIDKHGFIYRKDWAEKLGIETKTIMTYDDFIDMAVKFKEADLGGVGSANVMGLAVAPSNAPYVFVHAQNPNWDVFYKNKKGKYVSGYNDASTLEGLVAYKEAYDKGVLHPTFYTQKPADVPGYFYSGKAGILFQSIGANNLQMVKSSFADANPGLDPDECIDIMWIEGKDGKVRVREMANYWSCLYFNPDMDDEKFDAILSVLDYLCSEEGGRLITNGFEGKDYKIDKDGNITSIIPQNEDGTTPALSDLYGSVNSFVNLCTISYMGTGIKAENIQKMADLYQAKFDSKPDAKKLDLDIEFYSSDAYNKFMATNDITSIMAEIITSNKDTKKEWNKKIKGIQNQIDNVTKELNKNIK